VLDALDKLAARHPAAAGQLYRRAVQHLTKTGEQADDSDGVIGEAAARAVDGYAEACRAAPPDPVELAHWLIDFQLDGPGWPDISLGDFAQALGEDGLGAYRRHLAEQAAPTRAGSTDRFDHPRFTITHLREEYLASIEQDVDALVALYAEDLPEPYQYLRIGQTLHGAGRLDEAVDWLRRGLHEPDRPDGRVYHLLAEIYTETGRYADALDLRWGIFAGHPDVSTHQALLDAAERTGTVAETAERAMAHLREGAGLRGYAADPLVTILLATGDVDAAWAAVHEFGCSIGCLFTVAGRRAETHPADAIPVFAQAVEAAIDRKNKSGYAEAARLLAALKDMHARAGHDFPAYLQTITDTHRRKTTFLAELTRARL